MFISFPYFFPIISFFLNRGFNYQRIDKFGIYIYEKFAEKQYGGVKLKKLFEFESKQEKIVLLSIASVIILSGIIAFAPFVNTYLKSIMEDTKIVGQSVSGSSEISLDAPKTAREYYDMFQCTCCGNPIDTNCCGNAKQKKEYMDELYLDGIREDELVYQMVKKFGFDVLMDQSKEQDVKDYILSMAADNPPEIYIENTKYDFGIVSQSDGIISTIFTIKNRGKSDLIIENMDTSCMCTTASIIYDGKEGPVFGMSMHGDNPNDYSLTIPPGDTAQLKVYYDSMAHGVQKKQEMKITREVTIISNDPVDFQKKVRIELTQVP